MTLKTFALLCILAPLTRSAPLTFTLTATSDYSRLGYIAGQTYTFILTTGDHYDGQLNSRFDSTSSTWQGHGYWTSVGGTGVKGVYSKPTNPSALDSYINISSNYGDQFHLQAGANETLSGLTTLSSTAIGRVTVDFYSASIFSPTDTYIHPTVYFHDYIGDYTINPTSNSIHLVSPASNFLTSFSVYNLNISGGSTTIPEPSSYAVVFGLTALLGANSRRPRK
jgi:hypothetical protein